MCSCVTARRVRVGAALLVAGKWRVEKWLQTLPTVPTPVVYKDGETNMSLVF